MSIINSILSRHRNRAVDDGMIPTDVAVECVGHKWVVSIRNPGQSEWRALRNPTKLVTVRNHMDEEIRRIPAVHTFDTRKQAQDHVTTAIPAHRHIVRSAREISEFMSAVTGVAQ